MTHDYLHDYFEHGSGQRAWKIKPFVDAIFEQLKQLYYPGWECCIDEALVSFCEHFVGLQYIADKEVKYSFKLYGTIEPNGIMLDTHVYMGAADHDLDGIVSHAKPVVYRLMHDYLDKEHLVFMGNYYNSIVCMQNVCCWTKPSVVECCVPTEREILFYLWKATVRANLFRWEKET